MEEHFILQDGYGTLCIGILNDVSSGTVIRCVNSIGCTIDLFYSRTCACHNDISYVKYQADAQVLIEFLVVLRMNPQV